MRDPFANDPFFSSSGGGDLMKIGLNDDFSKAFKNAHNMMD